MISPSVRGHSLTTPTSTHLRSPPTYIHISLLSVHSYTYYYSLSSPTSPTFGDVAVHIPFPLILIPYCTIPILYASIIYFLFLPFFPHTPPPRRFRGTYSIPPHPHSILYHSHSPRFYNLLRP